MDIKTFTDYEELRQGTVFYQRRPFTGIVEFIITEKKADEFQAQSIDHHGYDIVMDRGAFQECVEQNKHTFYKDRLSAERDHELTLQKEREDFIDYYEDDKDAFLLDMLGRAYLYELERNDNQALAIKETARVHFPNLNFDHLTDPTEK